MKQITKFLILATLVSTALASCKKNVLDVPNENDPDFAKVYAKGEDVQNVAAGLFNTIYMNSHATGGVQAMLNVAADNVTCSHGNFGMWHLSSEPRDLAWDNSPSYSNRGQTKATYDAMYSAISTANNVIKAINSGVQIGTAGAGNDRVLAVARFIQGIGYGNLAMVYDKAHVVDEAKTVEPKLETALPYKDVATAALGYLDKAITLSANSFTIPKSWFGTATDLTNADFIKMCNTVAARIMSYTPRNKTELAAVNWGKVKTYADAGMTTTWNVVADNATWYDLAGYYLTLNGWGKTDMYVVNMMDPTQPQHWTNSASFPHPPASTAPIDQRLTTDFQFTPSNNFRPDRGYFNFSNYRHKRYDALYVTFIGPKPEIMKEENDLLKAEARAYTGDLVGAAAIINAGTRVTRGNMPVVAPVLVDIVKAIHHERHVELYTTGMGIQFFEMRKLNLLQKGTPLHLPIPAAMLEVLRLTPPFYTFGTVAKADGIGTSNAGWR